MPVTSWKALVEESKKASEFKLPDENRYSFVVAEKPEQSFDKNNDKVFTINATIESGEHKNFKVFHRLTVSSTPTRLRFFFSDAAAMGLPATFFTENDPTDDQICTSLFGARFTAELVHAKVGDKTYANLRNLQPATEPAPVSGVPTGLPTASPVASVPAVTSLPQAAPVVQEAVPVTPPVASPASEAAPSPWATTNSPPPLPPKL